MRARTRGAERPAAVLSLLGLAATMGVAALSTIGSTSSAHAADATAPAYSAEQTLTRGFAAADGTVETQDTRTVTVNVDVTTHLLAREVIGVSWTGARPSGARTSDPRGEKGLGQEYPVVVLQCRGLDDPTLPADQQLRPETCWTTFFKQRSDSVDPSLAVWRHDLYATEAERVEQSASSDWPAACPAALDFLNQYQVPFRAANGTVYDACNAESQAPEMGFDGALPPNDLAAFTGLDGAGRADFDVRTSVENESLGCSAATPCSLVVIPIMGMSCVDSNVECRKTGKAEPGSSYNVSVGSDPAVGPAYWWAPSNWHNRFVVPLSFEAPPTPCSALDSRSPVDFFGSELLNQASLQWAPAYCLDPNRFKYRHNRMSESVAFSTVLRGSGAAAFVSTEQDNPQDVAVGYAPVAVTGFAIAYAMDLPDNKGPVTSLRLNPRLLAKLLTQSYVGSSLGAAHEGMADNPRGLNQDPEFLELNPNASRITVEAMATVLSLSIQSDVVEALTSYIAADPEALAFVHGTKDEWGMSVNPSYEDTELPTREWELKDIYVPAYGQECQRMNFATSPYFSQIAAPVSQLATIAQDLLDAHPNVQTRCEKGTSTEPWKVGRVGTQDFGTRMMLGVVSLGDAVRYGLRTAELRTLGTRTGATFVPPSDTTLAAAVQMATQAAPGAPFLLDAGLLRSVPAAYPGTMIVHAVAKLGGLDATSAADVSRFISIATTEGQHRGTSIGDLPGGYLPIVAEGATAKLYASAEVVAKAIAAQSGAIGAVAATPTPIPTATPMPVPAAAVAPSTVLTSLTIGTAATPRSPLAPVAGAAVATTTTTTGQPADEAPAIATTAQRGATEAIVVDEWAGRTLPAALGVGTLALAGVPVVRQISVRRARL